MVGSQPDLLARLRSLLPGGWFSAPTPALNGVLSGFARLLSDGYGLVQYARSQARIKTATGGFLDLIALDYFGATLARRSGENDAALRLRVLASLFAEKATRRGVIKALEALTGRTPVIFEPARPADTGGYGIAMGYGVAGGYGSLLLPFQAFVTAYRPAGQGIPLVAGYGAAPGGYGTPSGSEYASLAQVIGQVTDADILAAVGGAMPVGTVAWTRIA